MGKENFHILFTDVKVGATMFNLMADKHEA
jgi:hypothetical protein